MARVHTNSAQYWTFFHFKHNGLIFFLHLNKNRNQNPDMHNDEGYLFVMHNFFREIVRFVCINFILLFTSTFICYENNMGCIQIHLKVSAKYICCGITIAEKWFDAKFKNKISNLKSQRKKPSWKIKEQNVYT